MPLSIIKGNSAPRDVVIHKTLNVNCRDLIEGFKVFSVNS
jgi:hypothetical protein